MQANIFTSTYIMWGKYIVLVLLQQSAHQQRAAGVQLVKLSHSSVAKE